MNYTTGEAVGAINNARVLSLSYDFHDNETAGLFAGSMRDDLARLHSSEAFTGVNKSDDMAELDAQKTSLLIERDGSKLHVSFYFPKKPAVSRPLTSLNDVEAELNVGVFVKSFHESMHDATNLGDLCKTALLSAEQTVEQQKMAMTRAQGVIFQVKSSGRTL